MFEQRALETAKKLMTALGRSPEQVTNTQSDEATFLHELVTQVLYAKGTEDPQVQADYLIDLEPEITKALSHKEIAEALTAGRIYGPT